MVGVGIAVSVYRVSCAFSEATNLTGPVSVLESGVPLACQFELLTRKPLSGIRAEHPDCCHTPSHCRKSRFDLQSIESRQPPCLVPASPQYDAVTRAA